MAAVVIKSLLLPDPRPHKHTCQPTSRSAGRAILFWPHRLTAVPHPGPWLILVLWLFLVHPGSNAALVKLHAPCPLLPCWAASVPAPHPPPRTPGLPVQTLVVVLGGRPLCLHASRWPHLDRPPLEGGTSLTPSADRASARGSPGQRHGLGVGVCELVPASWQGWLPWGAAGSSHKRGFQEGRTVTPECELWLSQHGTWRESSQGQRPSGASPD